MLFRAGTYVDLRPLRAYILHRTTNGFPMSVQPVDTSVRASKVRPPSLALAAFELPRAMAEMSSLTLAAPFLQLAPKGDGHPVMILPGFTAGDGSTRFLRRYLKILGYEVHGWELGRNYDHLSVGLKGERLAQRIETIHRAAGCKVSLVGWSLGGILAREAARRNSDSVRQVVSLGSPFAGDPRASNVWRFFEMATRQKLDSPQLLRRFQEGRTPPPVPSTAIYSKTDGIVAWQSCMEQESDHTDNIEVYGSHCGLAVNPAVLYAVADRLAQPEDDWKPFERSGCRAAFYPSSGPLH